MVRKMNKQNFGDDKDEEKDSRNLLEEDIFLNSLDFSHLINVKMTVRYFWGKTVGYFVVHLVRSHGFQPAQKVDVKLKVLIPVNIC